MNCNIKLEKNPNRKEIIDFIISASSNKMSTLTGSAYDDEVKSMYKELDESIKDERVMIVTLRSNDNSIRGIVFLKIPGSEGVYYSTILYAYLEPDVRETKCGAKLFYVVLNVISDGLGLTIKFPEWIPSIKGIRNMYDIIGFAVISEDIRTRLRQIFKAY